MLDSTEGLPGPVIMNRFGKPVTIRPSWLRGPCSHSADRRRPPRPSKSIFSSAPVMASKPVAKTMTSKS